MSVEPRIGQVWRLISSARFRALLSLGMVLGLGAVGTLAAWSSTATATSGTFTTGTIDLLLNGSQGNPTPVSILPGTGILPGQSLSGVVTATNSGTAALSYNLNVLGSAGLGVNLQLSIRAGGSTSVGTISGTTISTTTCSGGTLLTATPVNLTASNTQVITGRGPVVTGGPDALCIQLTLSATAPNPIQSTSGTATFMFDSFSTGA